MKPLALFVSALLLAGAAFAKDVTTQIKVSRMTCGACAVSVQKPGKDQGRETRQGHLGERAGRQ